MDVYSSSNSDEQELTVLLVDDDSNMTDSIKRIILGFSNKNGYSCKIKILSGGSGRKRPDGANFFLPKSSCKIRMATPKNTLI